MTRLVVDASVAVKWFFPEVHTEAARRALQEEYELLAPDLIWAEIGNAFWKKCRRGELTSDVARILLHDLRQAPIETAWDLAGQSGRSFYDSVYLALAVHMDCPLVTADLKFYNGLKRQSPVVNLLWVEDLP